MRLGLVISGVRPVAGGPLLLMVVRTRVVVMMGNRGRARMGEERKRGLSAHPVVNDHSAWRSKKGQKNSTTHDALHR